MSIIKKSIIFLVTFFLIIATNNISYSYSVGEVINISENDMSASNNTYCVALDKQLGGVAGMTTKHPYKIVQHVKIEGSTSTGDNGVTAESESNAILAAILAGPLEKGHGSYNNYKPAQQALYVFWDTWISNVGSSSYGLYDFGHNSGNSGKSPGANAAYYEQIARNYIADGTKCSVDIYFLRYSGPLGEGALQELIIAVPGPTTPPEEIPPDVRDYDGYIKISGKVWEDGEAGKSNDINGIYGDSTDKVLEGIKVTLKDKNGKEFVGGSSTKTDASGNYTITVNYDNSKSVYKLYEDAEVVRQKLIDGAYVEFEYDGLTYTTVSTNISGANTSKAMEDDTKRQSFDRANTVISPGKTITNTTLIATTRNVINSFGTYSDVTTEEQTVTTLFCNANGGHVTNTGTAPIGTFVQTNPDGAWLEPIVTNHEMHSEGDNGYWTDDLTKPIYETPIIGYDENNQPIYGDPYWTGEYEQKYISPTEWYWCSTGHALETTTITNLHILNVNLGLFKREQPDLALTSDIQQVDVTMKNQKYSYVYGNKGIDSTDQFFDTQVKFQNKYTYTYRRPVNPADIAYVNQNNTDDLKVQVTYKVLLKNQSNTLPVTVRELITYYDLDYTIIQCSSGSIGGTSNGEHCYSTIINNLNININPQESATLTIKYDISQSAIKGLLNNDATLNNIVEIYSFATQYGNNTLCAQQRTGGTIGKTGSDYAHYDIDSQPGNAGVFYDQANDRLDSSNYQDDTDIAPSFLLVKDSEKILSGTVWEDKATDESIDNNERLGNGVKDGNENVVANAKVELYRVKDDNTLELAKLYKINNGQVSAFDAVTYTDSNGNYNFTGAVTDNYIIKYTYGDNNINGSATTINGHSINARNYKSTIITTEPVKSVINGSNVSDKWHLTTQDNASVAVDNLDERANVDSQSLINNNFANPNNMSAYTKPFKMQVEYTVDQIANVDANGGTFAKELSIFDFGIIERPRENIVIDKTMSNLKITLANGQILIDGDPYNDNLDYVKALGNTITSRDVKARDKLVSIEIDTELIHGAKIDMTYAITATNNSEHDYDYTYGNSYYYYGDKGSLPLATTTIEKVVDYVDDELIVTTDGENGDWTIVDWNYLISNGYITQELYDGLENKNYSILTTEAFKDITTKPGENSKTIYMRVSKLLGNQENEYTYENHVEIIQIGGKIARTIKDVKPDGTQVEKEYKPGNYKPTDASRVHEPDDDRIIARITPPTGLINNIAIYIVIGIISLLIIGIGTYSIKKRVLGK